ncbi:twin-arginine translocation pathway signal [Aquincola sp. S2]|uniref:Twin-arginine translocation pathway signal n=1 Tax=Pseudaquabacterium terrae TaxID=2732868 RepID=A0ABX2EHB5_9BURK|nr:alpha/beta fold hydrolase [Aquabacterium terrae]NRF67966.1 twin-arginine translocation pathway signal [Aquabacterium terrae]
MRLARRSLLLLIPALLAACAASPPPASTLPPIVFVHGDGATAALWTTTLWRFESNGWPRARLHAVDFPYPLARDDDAKEQPGRSSSTEQRDHLAAEVQRVLKATGADKVVLIGNSRGGNAIRNYIQNGGGDRTVSHAILGGTPNHGAWAHAGFRPGNEFNGAGPFLTALNAPKGPNGDEVTPGVRWLTVRSDNNDKYAQPDGVWIGAKGTPTNVTFDGPALKGATNVVLPGRDHREVSYHALAFAAAHEFITGRAPSITTITSEQSVTLDGKVSGPGPGGPTNLPLAGAKVAVYAVDAGTGARRGAALVDKSVDADGRWGPLVTDSSTALEFVISAPGLATTHVYRSPFLRSSDIVHLRAERLADADKDAAAVVTLARPRGYFGLPRDQIAFDGLQPAPGIPPGVAGVSSSKLKLRVAPGRPVTADYRSGDITERLIGTAWPARDNHVVLFELHH